MICKHCNLTIHKCDKPNWVSDSIFKGHMHTESNTVFCNNALNPLNEVGTIDSDWENVAEPPAFNEYFKAIL